MYMFRSRAVRDTVARGYQSISPARRALSSKPAARRCCCGSTGQTDRRTDGHAGTVNKAATLVRKAGVISSNVSDGFVQRYSSGGPIYKISYDNLTIILR